MFVNSHTHLYSGLAPLGMPPPAEPPQNFLQNLERIWWRLDRALDGPSLRAGARYYLAHARQTGTAALIDHHESPNFIEGSLDVLAEACLEAGIAAVLCYGSTERNGGGEEARRGLHECRRFILENRRQGIVGLVGLHASFTVSDETIRTAGAMCRELNTVLHIHLAEDRADVDDARRRGYPGPLQRLVALDALPAGSILVHGVHLSAHDVAQASDAGCWFVQNPRSNRKNRVGYPSALRAGARVALGTDGFPSDMCDEAVALEETTTAAGGRFEDVASRVDAGWRLIEERLGLTQDDAERLSAIHGPPGSTELETIEAEAREQASRLWARW